MSNNKNLNNQISTKQTSITVINLNNMANQFMTIIRDNNS